MLYVAGVLYLIACRLGCELEPLGIDWLDDVVNAANDESDTVRELMDDLERVRQQREEEW